MAAGFGATGFVFAFGLNAMAFFGAGAGAAFAVAVVVFGATASRPQTTSRVKDLGRVVSDVARYALSLRCWSLSSIAATVTRVLAIGPSRCSRVAWDGIELQAVPTKKRSRPSGGGFAETVQKSWVLSRDGRPDLVRFEADGAGRSSDESDDPT